MTTGDEQLNGELSNLNGNEKLFEKSLILYIFPFPHYTEY